MTGKYMAELIRPLLNGPVTFSVSILLGTLVAMTIQTLYDRQVKIHHALVSCIEEVRELSLFVRSFPDPYRTRGQELLDAFLSCNVQNVKSGTLTPDSLRSQTYMESFSSLLIELSNRNDLEKRGYRLAHLDQVFASVQRIKAIRTDLTATLFTVFSSAHYATIVILACTLLFVFLLETDQEAMQFLVGFQLSLCWALLIGTYSMLGAIIFDLTTPFTGVFTAYKGTAEDMDRARAYALAMDRVDATDNFDLLDWPV
jgi:Protein of unknown function (DUF4239)